MARKELSPDEVAAERRHSHTTYRASLLATLASTIAIAGFVGPLLLWVGRPAVVAVMAEAMSPAVHAQVRRQLTPVHEGLKVIIANNIATLEDDIAELERRDRAAGLDELDTQKLTRRRRELRSQQQALSAIASAERAN